MKGDHVVERLGSRAAVSEEDRESCNGGAVFPCNAQ